MDSWRISVQPEDFDAARESARLRLCAPNAGALVCFTGLVREHAADGRVSALYIEHYPGMTERSLAETAGRAAERWPLLAGTVIHRVGYLGATEQIVLVCVASEHRAAAFEACEFIMDELKTTAPFWKKEEGPSGGRWVEARPEDAARAHRWRR